ncbi:MAG: Protease synthase and sporulation protein 2 [Planctomycetota bacterium]|jgi:transcriptional regulator
MHIPAPFAWTDRAGLVAFCRAHPFATVVHAGADGCEAQHIPLLVDIEDGAIVIHGHVARGNPLAAATAATVVFHGPHAFVSAAWYGDPDTVPTWNYLTVHAAGPLALVTDPAAVATLTDRLSMTDPEASQWRRRLDPAAEARLLQGIHWFRITVTRFEGKAKLSQNHPVARRHRVIDRLAAAADPQARQVAAAMARVLGGETPWPAEALTP